MATLLTHSLVVDVDHPTARINPNIYGHFIEHLGQCVYGGLWVGPDSEIENVSGLRRDVVEALRRIKLPVIRWPGGCFADDYHWRDGMGPRSKRPKRVNAHWGMVTEDNAFGTHEFMELCRQLDAEPYICGNVGGGTIREMRDWIEYMNFDGDSTLARLRAKNGHPEPFGVNYFGLGNENWGCGGNMRPEYYADLVRRYASFIFFEGTGLTKIACGPAGDNPAWTQRFFQALSGDDSTLSRIDIIQGFALHYYCGTAGTATGYTENQWYELLQRAMKVEEVLLRHRAIMDGFDPKRRISLVVDEWGTWHPPMEGTNPKFLKQQNTIRDALVAALTLDIFNRNADKVAMANIAQMVNVLQALVLTDGPKMLLTPTYHVYDMYSPHQGADSLPCRVSTEAIGFDTGKSTASVPTVAGSCSRKGNGITVSLVNLHARQPAVIDVKFRGTHVGVQDSWRCLAAQDIHDHNTFEEPDRVAPIDRDVASGEVVLPPASVNVLTYPLLGNRHS